MKNIRRFAIFAPWGEEAGFRLGGATTVAVAGADQFNAELTHMISSGEVGMIAIPTAWDAWIDDENHRRLERTGAPLITRYRYPESWSGATTAVDETEELAYRATGFHFRIRL